MRMLSTLHTGGIVARRQEEKTAASLLVPCEGFLRRSLDFFVEESRYVETMLYPPILVDLSFMIFPILHGTVM